MTKLTIATLALAAAMLSTVAHAQTVNICERTPQVRDAIMGQVDSTDCAAVDGGDLADITRLRGARVSGLVSGLKAGDFEGLIRLQTLDLRAHYFTRLPAGLFRDLGSLQTLYLGDNRLTSLPAGVFRGLDSLEELHLHENRLTTLPAGVFRGLSRLEGLLLYSNRLTTLPVGVFDGLGSLRELYLHENRLTTLPAGVFRGLGNLVTLYLNSNWLVSLPDGLFDGVGNLEFLYLQNNHLVDLSRDDPLFEGIPSVDLRYQTDPPDGLVTAPAPVLSAAVPLLLSASHSGRQGFIRIVNTTDDAGTLRVSAIDDGGNLAGTVEMALAANQSTSTPVIWKTETPARASPAG